jgi:hypothetical protein
VTRKPPFPPLTADEEMLLKNWIEEEPLTHKRALSPFVVATAYSERQDAAVFGRFVALYLLDDVPWLLRGVLASDASGAPVVRRLALEPWHEEGPEVTSEVTHRVRVALVRDRALEQLRLEPQLLRLAEIGARVRVTTQDRHAAEELAGKAGSRKRGRPPLYGPEHYAHIARECIALYRQGQRGIRATLARKHNVSEARIRDWIKRARELGFLAESKHGKADYRPGPNLTAKEENDG